ncbi:hypothetical protein D1872_341190 [compost metagenome]
MPSDQIMMEGWFFWACTWRSMRSTNTGSQKGSSVIRLRSPTLAKPWVSTSVSAITNRPYWSHNS